MGRVNAVGGATALKAAVVGVGNMGRNHVRVYAEMEAVRLVAVADSDPRTIQRVAGTYGVARYADYREILEKETPDVVSVAVPTKFHGDVACEAIKRGAHVLVEKPLALTEAEGRRIIEAAASHDVKIMVGHIERFNPGIVEIKSGWTDGSWAACTGSTPSG